MNRTTHGALGLVILRCRSGCGSSRDLRSSRAPRLPKKSRTRISLFSGSPYPTAPSSRSSYRGFQGARILTPSSKRFAQNRPEGYFRYLATSGFLAIQTPLTKPLPGFASSSLTPRPDLRTAPFAAGAPAGMVSDAQAKTSPAAFAIGLWEVPVISVQRIGSGMAVCFARLIGRAADLSSY